MTDSKRHVSDKVQTNNSVRIQFLQALSAEGRSRTATRCGSGGSHSGKKSQQIQVRLVKAQFEQPKTPGPRQTTGPATARTGLAFSLCPINGKQRTYLTRITKTF